jgi:catechol 2,3-dioxygenase-like lactoylglutathione lyase family enzyme
VLNRSEAILAVRDVKEAVDFYTQKLGFSGEWLWGDPVTFGGVRYGEVGTMFGLQPKLAAQVDGHQHAYFTDRIDELHADHVQRGAPIVSPIEDKPWGLREYTVRDPNGYHLRFGGRPGHVQPPGALATLPAHILIEDRLPTWPEYNRLHESVKWGPVDPDTRVLETSLLGCVAIDTRMGSAVGMARAMRDAQRWFSIWDVAVHPDYQCQRIGTTLMQRITARLRQVAPKGSIVHLFTFQQSFYARLGFNKESCSLLRM